MSVLRRVLTNALPLTVLLALFNLVPVADSTMVAKVFAIVFLLVVPGTTVLSLTPLRPKETSIRLAWTVGVSMLILMLLGLALSLVLPHLGVTRPLSQWPLAIGVDAVTLGCLGVSAARADPLDYLTGGRPPGRAMLVVAGACTALVLASIAGAERLNNDAGGAVALVVLVGIGVIILGLIGYAHRLPQWSISAGLYAVTVASLLMTSMRSNYVFGYDIQSEYQVFASTFHAGIWHAPTNGNAYAAMLSITILPTVLSVVSHASGTYIFKLVYPLVFSLFPVIVFVISARWFTLRASIIGATVVVAQGLYTADITELARQEIGLLYFALFVVTAFDAQLSRHVRQGAVIVAGVAMAISHYSTAYFASIVLVLGYLAYGLLRLVHRLRGRPTSAGVVTLPVLALVLGSIALWNVTITHSAENVTNLVSSIEGGGLKILSGPPGSSFLQRFLSADVSSGSTPTQFVPQAVSYYHQHASYLHPYPATLTAKYPVRPVTVPGTIRHVPASLATVTDDLQTVVSELLLLGYGVGVLLLLWRERGERAAERTELAAFALGTIVVLGVLRLSGTISTLYNAPRGQVQGAPLLSVGLAVVCTWLFARRRFVAAVCASLVGFGVGILLLYNSGLADYVFGGGGTVTLVDYGESYQRYYFTDADIASATWVVGHYRPGDIVYADTYGGLQIYHVQHISGLVTTVVPQVIEPGAWVYATSTNVVDHADRSTAGDAATLTRYPMGFLENVKNLVFTTTTTRVFK